MLEFIEQVNIEKVKYLISLNNWELVQYNDIDHENNKEVKYFANRYKAILIDILIMCESTQKQDDNGVGFIKRKYNQKSHRYYVESSGIQQLSRHHRDFIIRDNCFDYDMKNAFPSLLYYLCKTNNLPCKMLKLYIDDRESILSEGGIEKIDFLSMMNKDKLPPAKTTDPTIRLILDEILKNKKKLIDIYKNIISKDWSSEEQTKPKKERGKNMISSKMCNILMYYENMLLQKVFEKYGDYCSIPMYDGFISTNKIEIEDLNEITKEYGVEWAYKPFHTPYVYNSDYEMEQIYEIEKKEFEKKYFYITSQNCFKVLMSDGSYETICKKNVEDVCENIRVRNHKGDLDNFLKVWMKDRKRQEYESQQFLPYTENNDTPDNIFNSFEGFKSKRVDYTEDDIKWFDDYLKKVFKKTEIIEYLKYYIADILQNPKKNPKVCIVLKGVEGTGKDSLIDIISALVGSLYMNRSKGMDDLFGTWNNIVSNKLVICMNEVQGKDGITFLEDLKEFITQDELQVREKFVSARTIRQLYRLIVLSNNYAPINISPTDRRFLVVETSMEMAREENIVWWEDLHENYIQNIEVMNKLFSYLIDLDISKWNAKQNKPKTDSQNFLATRNISPPLLYIHKYINNNCIGKMEEPFIMKQSHLNEMSVRVSKKVLDRRDEIRKMDIRKTMDKHNCIFSREKSSVFNYCSCWVAKSNQAVLDHLNSFDFKMYDDNALDWNNMFEDGEEFV